MYPLHVSDPGTYVNYYLNQAGHGNAAYYRGSRVQRGFGFGSIFSRLFRFAMPLIKRGAVHVGEALARTGANVAADAATGANIKESARTHFKNMGQRLVGDAAGYVKSQVGEGGRKRKRRSVTKKSTGKGVKRKRSSSTHQKLRRRKRSKFDIFTS
jgi:hypothetical protein